MHQPQSTGTVDSGLDVAGATIGADVIIIDANEGADPEKRKRTPDNHVSPSFGLPQDMFLFSNTIQKETSKDSTSDQLEKTNRMPDTRLAPVYEFSRLPGHTPLINDFHLPSNREREGPEDEGLDDEDLSHADGKVRKKKSIFGKRKSIIYDNIWISKGEFLFPYRTYRPKVQVSYKGGNGQVPQAVVCERLHRVYKRTDINLVLQTLGVENSDIIPPPHYAETNERFYQEMCFRNRVRVNGIFKKDYILQGKNAYDHFQEEHLQAHLHAPKLEGSSLSYPSSDRTPSATSGGNTSSTIPTIDKEKSKQDKIRNGQDDGQGTHPFIKSKPPFGPMFPLHCFDNYEYDIRPPEDWMSLCIDPKDKKFFPLPGKAFLPLPGNAHKKKSPALSETVVDNNLLTATPRLSKLYHWLMRERFERTVQMLGIDPNKVKSNPTDVELSMLARLGSTVPSLFRNSDTNFMERITMHHHLFYQPEIPKIEESVIVSISEAVETSGSGSTSTDSKEKKKSVAPVRSLEFVDSFGAIIPVRNVVKRKKGERKSSAQQSQADDTQTHDEDLGEDADITLNADTTEAQETMPQDTENEDDEEETDIEEWEEEEDGSNEWSGLAAEAILLGDYGKVRPTSPDIDSLMDGHEKYVIEFDKMKKVHVHDWKWVDVAVYDYNEITDKFYVRTIFEPIVHAWVDKLYLCFDGEDPNQHGKRIRDAVIRRIESENIMRFNLYIDCLDMEGFEPIEPKIMDIVLSKTLNAPKIEYNDKTLDTAKKEIDLEFKRTSAKARFIKIIEKHHHLYKPWVVIPEQDHNFLYMTPQDSTLDFQRLQKIRDDVPIKSFAYKKLQILKMSVRFGEKEPRDALNRIRDICIEARRKSLLLVDLEPLSLEEWEDRQENNIKEIRSYLLHDWYQKIVKALHDNLGKIPNSWYNLKETNYEMFKMSKLHNYLILIKLMLEETIRSMVAESLEKFVIRLKEVTSEIDLKRRFAWNENDLITSLYPTPKDVSPIWKIDILMEDSARYSRLLSDFSKVVRKLFTQAVEAVKDLPTILPKVMPQMKFAISQYLLCPDESEPRMQQLHTEIQRFLKKALLPLDSYVLLYNRYMDIWNTDIFLKEWNNNRHTAEEVADEVDLHRSQEGIFEKEIPKVIYITGFEVNVEVVREELLDKKKNMYTTILDAQALKLKRVIEIINSEYEEMERKLNIRSDIIEEVKELRIYTAAVPLQVEKLQEINMQIIKDYEVFDRYLYPIDDEDVTAMWQTAVYAGAILRLSKAALTWLMDDYDKSLELQQQELNGFSEIVEELDNEVKELSRFVVIEYGQEVCLEIERLTDRKAELQEKCTLLNRRQAIFGFPPLLQEELDKIVADLEPYRNLWTNAVAWLKVTDSVNTGSLEEVDIDALVSVINDGLDYITDCAKYFKEAGLKDVQSLAESIKQQMEEFLPLAPLMKILRDDSLRQRHWEAISELTGIEVVNKTENFKNLLDQGISNFAEKIVEIGELALKELEIEVSLQAMQETITQYEVKHSMDPVSKQHLISMSEEVKEVIDDFVSKTEELKSNPYNAPFEEEMTKWSKNINMTKSSMELWLRLQIVWLDIEQHFKSPDVKTRLPVEFKLFEKMQRIWKRLIRHAKSKPQLIVLASDSTVAASLSQFDELSVTMKKALDEFMRPKDSDEDSD